MQQKKEKDSIFPVETLSNDVDCRKKCIQRKFEIREQCERLTMKLSTNQLFMKTPKRKDMVAKKL